MQKNIVCSKINKSVVITYEDHPGRDEKGDTILCHHTINKCNYALPCGVALQQGNGTAFNWSKCPHHKKI